MEDQVHKFLTLHEFPTKLMAYHYLKDSIKRTMGEGILPNKILFAGLSEQYQTDSGNIERCLRTLVDKMWQRVGLFTKRATNREFILRCTEHIAANTPSVDAYTETERANGNFHVLDKIFENDIIVR